MAGALRGIEAVPKECGETAQTAVLTDPYTVSKVTARQSAEGNCQAALTEMRKSKAAGRELDSLIETK